MDGDGAGQFHSGVEGIAVDSEGGVYVVDLNNRRIQKFDADGHFLLTFGGGVDLGPNHPGNLCTAAYISEGDSCGAGSEGAEAGQFGAWDSTGTVGSFIAVGPDDTVYVGDEDRIQKFDTEGHYTGQLALPEDGVVHAVAVDYNSGDIYFAYGSSTVRVGGEEEKEIALQPNVYRLKATTGAVVGKPLNVMIPKGIAVASNGDVYVIDQTSFSGSEANPFNHQARVLQFNSTGSQLGVLFEGEFERSTGIAVSSACGNPGVSLFISNADFSNAYVSAYGSPPNPAICAPPPVPPAISAQYAIAVGSDGATLAAQINPHFWSDATYYVEYGAGKCSEGGCDREQPLPPGAKLTTATTAQNVTTAGVFLNGLEPNTTYHYRFVVQSSGGGPVRGLGGGIGNDGLEGIFNTFPASIEAKEDCPNQRFRTAASAKLPDCRAYEMVSPVDKNGGDVATLPVRFGTLAEASADGQRATFSSLASFLSPSAAPLVNQYLSSRGAAGWSTEAISPPRLNPALWPPGSSGQFKTFDEDLCGSLMLEESGLALAPEAPPGVANIYWRENCGVEASYELLTPVPPAGFGAGKVATEFYVPAPLGFSADKAHVVYRADAKLTANACDTPGIYQVYETSREGPLRLISVLPNGKATCSHSAAGTMGSLTDGFREATVFHAVSTDGSRVFWTDSGEPVPLQNSGGSHGVGAGKLYVRVNATRAPSGISAGKCTEAEKACTLAISGSKNTQFWSADLEGSTAIYTADGELFRFDVENATSQSIAKGVQSVVGTSEDASRVYFVSTEVLAGAGANSESAEARAGEPNLYLAEGAATTYIATLGKIEGNAAEPTKLPSLVGASRPFLRTSRVSPDGLHLAFTSAQSLTGYDNTDLVSGAADAEVYLYDVSLGGPGQLTCVSCNPSEARPRGRLIGDAENGKSSFWAAAQLPGWPEQLRPSRLLSDDGSRLLFNSFDALVPPDTNGKQDAYEWKRASSPAECTEVGAQLFVASAGGCLSLISSGQSAADSEVTDASQNGSDIFFITRSSLLPQDPGLYDLYDAREGGGYPPPPSVPPSCEGEACQGSPAPPNDPTPASSAFEGSGNVTETAKKKKPSKKKAHKRKQAKRANHKRRAGR